ncbi:MAG TPA: response regulator transcription factor [Sphingomicrobium sp.]|nr:response regulator transcription factor [Sphingomicrobium sp.]
MSKIFLADDHPMIRAALNSLLCGSGHEMVGCATSGAEALEQIGQSDADVLVLDVQMPGGSGLHVLGELRARGDTRPVVLLTAAIGDETIRSALSLGVSGIVLKTSDPTLLIEAVEAVDKGETWIDERVQERLSALSSRGPARRALSDRERELIRLVRQGLKNRDIAERLRTTEGTVKAYLHAIFDKVGVENRTELAMRAPEIIGPD